jgi:hypothetical protein
MPISEEAIKQAYYSEQGFGSIKSVLKDAQAEHPDVAHSDAKAWMDENVPRLKRVKGRNSCVAPGPKCEFQIDLFYYNFEQAERPILKHQQGKKDTWGITPYGLLAVHSFTKYVHFPRPGATEGVADGASQSALFATTAPQRLTPPTLVEGVESGWVEGGTCSLSKVQAFPVATCFCSGALQGSRETQNETQASQARESGQTFAAQRQSIRRLAWSGAVKVPVPSRQPRQLSWESAD